MNSKPAEKISRTSCNSARAPALIGLSATAFSLGLMLGSTAIAADDPRWVEIPEIQWLSTTEVIPTYEYAAAHHGLLNRRTEQSRGSLTRLAAFLKAEGYRASAGSKIELEGAAQTIAQLASRVERASAPSVTELDRAFARAQRAIATHYLELAQRAADTAPSRAARYLEVAARGVESAAYRAGQTIGTAERNGLHEAHAVAEKVAAGQDWSGAKAADVFDRVQTILASLKASGNN